MAAVLTAVALVIALGLALTFVVGPAFLAIVAVGVIAVLVWLVLAGGRSRPLTDQVRDVESPDCSAWVARTIRIERAEPDRATSRRVSPVCPG